MSLSCECVSKQPWHSSLRDIGDDVDDEEAQEEHDSEQTRLLFLVRLDEQFLHRERYSSAAAPNARTTASTGLLASLSRAAPPIAPTAVDSPTTEHVNRSPGPAQIFGSADGVDGFGEVARAVGVVAAGAVMR